MVRFCAIQYQENKIDGESRKVILYKILGRWGRLKTRRLEEYKEKFIQFNAGYWRYATKSESNSLCLVEGLLGEMPTHLIRMGISAKAIENKFNIKPLVILNSRLDSNIHMFKSFGIDRFIFLDEISLSIKKYIYAIFKFIAFLIFPNVHRLLLFKYKKVNIGKLIYDDILHSYNNCYTLKKVNIRHLKFIWRALLYISKYDEITNDNNVKLILLSHNEYIAYGTLAIAALRNRKKVVTVNDVEVSQYTEPNEVFWHKRFQSNIKKIILKNDDVILEKEGQEYLTNRIYGAAGLFDTKSAFDNKHFYTLNEIRNHITKNNYKNVFIYMHVFSDAPHLSEMDMYKDYYDWICDTISVIKKVPNINWFIKIHPSAYLYGETDKVKNTFEFKDHIFLVPDNFNSASIRDVADVVITCQGTVGLEASCMGIPVIITGKPFYGGFGFTLEPRTKKEYHEMLKKCENIKKLTSKKVKTAEIVLGAFHRFQYIDKSILDDYVYEYAGYGKRISYDKSFDRIRKNMMNYSYDQLKLYHRVYETIDI